MKKKLTVLLFIMSIVLCNVVAGHFVDVAGKDKLQAATDPALTAVLDLNANAIAKVGFASKPVTDFNADVTELIEVKINKKNKDGLTFYSPDFYVYWNIMAGAKNIPSISFKINTPLTTAGNYKLNWKVSWKDYNGGEYTEANSITSGPNPVSKNVFTEKNKENILKSHTKCLVLKAETTDPYWMGPIAKYTGDLWIIVEAGQ